MKLQFTTVDVFTDRQFGGNPLAVVTNAQGLSTERMQAIAAEFNLAETTFVLPPQDPAHTARVRIFTPKAEMPFAGHPNVGTAFVLARAGESYGRKISGDRLVFEEKAGLVNMDLTREGGIVVATRLAAPVPLSLGEEIAPEIVLQACSLKADDLKLDIHPPRVASCGVPLLFVELKSRAALRSAAPRPEVFARDLPRDRVVGIHLYVQAKEGNIDIQSRMFAPEHGIPEDPATGGANVALIGLLAYLRPEADLTLDKIIGQGFDMGRPSVLVAASEKKAGKVVANYIGGRCMPMMSGVIDLG
ncbi:MAG: PhzF family phenazine biosynthesis protein [Reyranella sp.]|uniref:PhzF family phenazine biosynthesis protein n=1 Tax=Reyranella sp. TaxID=1929291 RepID=UPI0011FAB2FF|nr:PhzF family phenazine biosynthesis protein [Reyranella sp.]TAJ38738.1 MAG: PhzF family phenazine biosynthesis protein [Reyranella sp.]